MKLISLLLSMILIVIPPSTFKCDGEPLKARIINNENGDFSEVKDLQNIDKGAFVVLDWKSNLMLPRTFIANEISFSDNKWKWVYKEGESPKLLEKKSSTEIKEYECVEN